MGLPTQNPSWARILEAHEKHLGVHLGFYDFKGRLRPLVGEAFLNHRAPVCLKAKARDLACCKSFEGRALARLGEGRPVLWKRCPFGVHELLFAIRGPSGMEGALFVGPFEAPRGTGLEDLFSIDTAPRARSDPGPQAQASWIPLLAPLLSGLEATLGRVPEESGRTREDQVHHFFGQRYLSSTVHVGQLAAELGLSPSATRAYLKRRFKKGFNELLTLRRMEMAALLLRYGEERVEGIALKVGYEHARSFDKAFRRVHGMSPGRWRQDRASGV
ncbi:MAG: helix-turn-helix transcriptional regulator [Spirochaetes bacterium]|nr:helix-turn-helix transcriptional regulator [Spirochaetota bacterium]